jgi:hypothetical protein
MDSQSYIYREYWCVAGVIVLCASKKDRLKKNYERVFVGYMKEKASFIFLELQKSIFY